MDNENIDSVESTDTHVSESTTVSMDTVVAPATPSEYEYVPEKFMADGKPDFEKMAGSYKSLEGKLGTRVADAASDVSEYDYVPEGVEITNQEQYDGFKELALKEGLSPTQFQSMVDQYQSMNGSTVESVEDYNYDFSITTDDDAVNDFKEHAMEMGLNADQYNQIMGAYEAEMAQYQPTPEQTQSTLKDAWGTNYDANLNQAFDAMKELNLDISEVRGNTAAIKILATLGSEMKEDNAPNATTNSYNGITQLEVNELMKSDDYFDNKEKQKMVSGFFSR